MSLLLYAITDAPGMEGARPAAIAGVAVTLISAGSLTAVAAEIEGAPSREPEALWRFEAVLEALMAEATVLPVRYGTVLADAPAVRSMLDARRAAYAASLDRVRGAVEIGVRGRWAGGSEFGGAEPSSGTDYMRARLEARRRADRVAARVLEQLGARARESRVRVLPSPGVPFSAAFLIDRASEPEFVGAVHDLEDAVASTELVCTGPWPVHSFAEADD